LAEKEKELDSAEKALAHRAEKLAAAIGGYLVAYLYCGLKASVDVRSRR